MEKEIQELLKVIEKSELPIRLVIQSDEKGDTFIQNKAYRTELRKKFDVPIYKSNG